MFGQNREKKRFSWRWAVLLVALVAGSLLLAACGDSDPSPTATSEPTSVQATPDEDGDAMMDEDGDAMMDEDGDAMMDEDGDAVMDKDGDAMMDEDGDAMMDKDGDAMMDKDGDAMMDKDGDAMMDKDGDAMMDKDGDAVMDKDGDAMMDKDGDAMMDKDGDAMMDKDGDAMMSLSDIDETTTGAELIASLSDDEAACLRAAIGDASYEAMQDLALSESAMGFDTFPLQCLEPDNAIDLSVAMMSLQAGGLSNDSRACIKDVFADLGVPGEGMSMTDSMRSFITMQPLPDRRRSASHVGTGSRRRRISFALPTTLRIRADGPGQPVHRLPGLCRPGVEHGAAHTIAGNDDGVGRDNGGSGGLRHSHHHPGGGVSALGGGSGLLPALRYPGGGNRSWNQIIGVDRLVGIKEHH